ncbi:MAG: DUF302 domain-containing protein [Marinovum algicola]|uniref:Uncharacterized conserved protein, DUF302 family n=2 Tax=Rhodobacterales TaxID=204455 RepID=A0A975WB13_9RHOB|nr:MULTISPECIES: DUF302 domain-containing protein [Marinovum]AKO95623.1 hypothetical protein MALG_00419 [Marinovum algicola DG 898]MDD9743867.1 DUF302 domain-containing protein [Marinovum sp. PR37]SEJ67127.1 Uncharacterized conserved protein, DUF302 family [Marinovum algicola]SLN54287.1 hypothetical protein MAA5396_02874 [Marinovum algicola]
MLRSLILALPFLAATGAGAETVKVATGKSVAEAAEALAQAIEAAGATLFARVDHGAGAQKVGQDIGASELLIFGNPEVGTPAMVEAREAGLALPLKVLVYEDRQGGTWLAYEAPAERLADLADGALPSEVTDPMTGALRKLTAKAAE